MYIYTLRYVLHTTKIYCEKNVFGELLSIRHVAL